MFERLPTGRAAQNTPMVSQHTAAILSALLVTFLWSTSWILVRWGLDDEDLAPLGFAALRYGLAASVLLVWTAARPASRPSIREIDRSMVGSVLALGLVMYALTQGAQFVAIDQQPAATTSLVLSATPLLVGFASARAVGEPPTARQLLGGVLVAAGAGLYFSGSLGATTIGMVAAIVAVISNSAASLLGRTVNRHGKMTPTFVTTSSMTIGALILAAASLVDEGWPSVSGRAWLIIGWLAVVNTAGAFTLWNLSLRSLSAVESAGINTTMLMQIALLAWWLLDEGPGVLGMAGLLVASAGVLMTQLGRRHSARH